MGAAPQRERNLFSSKSLSYKTVVWDRRARVCTDSAVADRGEMLITVRAGKGQEE